MGPRMLETMDTSGPGGVRDAAILAAGALLSRLLLMS